MKINRIELYNIGSYEGHNEFDIANQKKNGNIVIVGGKNGAGKTTLFTSIKLCLYGYKESGYQSLSATYKREIKRLINDKAKAENNANAYVLLDLDILNGQDWDQYVLKREWSLDGEEFEKFFVSKNGKELSEDEKVDFDNFLMNLLPPELFELYFFDGEQIADYFLEDGNNERIKNAFLTICGYDTFDIIYKNFKRISKQQGDDSDPTTVYLKTEDELRKAEINVSMCEKEIQFVIDEIEAEDSKLRMIEESFRTAGGLSAEEWNSRQLEIKSEERFREEKNAWIKNAMNDTIPYIILNRELKALYKKMETEKEAEKLAILQESVISLIPEVLSLVSEKNPKLDFKLQKSIIEELSKKTSLKNGKTILNLSKQEYTRLLNQVLVLLNIDKNEIITARQEIETSIRRSQAIRADLELSSMDGADRYLQDKEETINKKEELINKRETLLVQLSEYKETLELTKLEYQKAEKELEKHFKSKSVTALTAKSILFLESLQKRLYETEIEKVKELFMKKMSQLMRKDQFIDRIEIDDMFNIHVFKKVDLDVSGIREKLLVYGVENYMLEYGKIHCEDLLKQTKCKELDEIINSKKAKKGIVNVLMEFDKSTMSKGEKQVFIMSLYWAIMQLCKKDVPFIIDTPFARIDTEHRAHITKYFFKELKGQIFVFSTDEEITPEHIKVIGKDLGGKFLIENIDNTRTSIVAGKYFGE